MRFIGLLASITLLFSCGTPQYLTYDVPKYVRTPHSEVMSTYTTKEKVMLEFGAPDKEAQVNKIDIIEYKLGEISRGKTRGVSNTVGQTTQQININNTQATQLDAQYSGVSMTENNPFYSTTNTTAAIDGRTNGSSNTSISNVVNNQYIQSTTIYSGSETYPKYAKFWLINDKVVKWESVGIDKSVLKPNPKYSLRVEKEIDTQNQQIFKARSDRRGGVISVIAIVGILTIASALVN